jgi:hypothetical protein
MTSATPLIEQLITSAQSAAAQMRVRSALNPMLWLCAIVTAPCFVLAWLTFGKEPLSTILTYAALTPLGVTCVLALIFGIFKPDKMQSEEYQIRHEALELIRQKGSPIEVSPSSLEGIANPVLRVEPGPQ